MVARTSKLKPSGFILERFVTYNGFVFIFIV